MKNSFRLKDSEIDINLLKRAASMTTLERMEWLEEARRFYLKAIPKSTLRAAFRFRDKENKD
jgi:hypothetical protein